MLDRTSPCSGPGRTRSTSSPSTPAPDGAPCWGSRATRGSRSPGGAPTRSTRRSWAERRALLVDTVERLTGVRIDSYVLTGFQGFQGHGRRDRRYPGDGPYLIVDAFARQAPKGPQRLNGANALAFSRARHAVPGGDFGRSLNQGRVLIAALSLLRDQANRGPAALLPWVIAGARNVHRTWRSPTCSDSRWPRRPSMRPQRGRERAPARSPARAWSCSTRGRGRPSAISRATAC